VANDDKTEALNKFVSNGKARGYVYYDEIDKLLPTAYERGSDLDDIFSELARSGIDIIEEPTRAKGNEFNANYNSVDELQQLKETHAVEMYLREVMATPHLTREQEIALAEHIRAGGDVGECATKRLIEANLRLVVATVECYRGRGRDLLDLLQEGNIGLMEAVKRFDPTREYKLSTYAIWWIRRRLNNEAPMKR
jgi:RNA polymerase primary sigma factor